MKYTLYVALQREPSIVYVGSDIDISYPWVRVSFMALLPGNNLWRHSLKELQTLREQLRELSIL